MRRLTADHFVHEMSELHSSAYTIGDGETVVIETLDCDGGMRARDGLVRSWPTRPNPATGPVEVVDGAISRSASSPSDAPRSAT